MNAHWNELALANRHPRLRVDLPLLRRIALAALADAVFCPATPGRGVAAPRPAPGARVRRRSASVPARLHFQLGCYLVGSRAITALNEHHLGHAGATDVISFDYGAPPEAPPGEAWLRGDIFICLDVARMQARRFRTSWPAEIVRYLVHGLLHLRGFDDCTPVARRVMKRQEARLVTSLAARFPIPRLQPHARAARPTQILA